MFVLISPSEAAVQNFLKRASTRDYSYPEVGATRGELPQGYTVDHNRVRLGPGAETFRKAVSALKSWQMFNLGWVRVHAAAAPIRVGSPVAVVVRHFGFWSLNASRIVYVIDEERRFGFAYGTLRDHAESGEERFCIEWDSDDSVAYDLLSFSKPHAWPVKVLNPLARVLQKKFARDSMLAMKRAVVGDL
jgi:uncharacterized protein (UPF0548 family)